MLRSPNFAQFATLGIKHFRTNSSSKANPNHLSTIYPGPIRAYWRRVVVAMDMLPQDEKHWFCGGMRSIAVAMHLLRKNEVIAVPTDTIYGFAALAQSDEAIEKLYAIKGREKTKPLAITLSSVKKIEKWANTDSVSQKLLSHLLPGPVTVVLKRKPSLNPRLNPGHETVGVRVPGTKFIRCLSGRLKEPLALTSANISNEPSTLHPDEFSALWPKLGGIFYDIQKKDIAESQRNGSTVVDLTVPGEYEILRRGVRFNKDIHLLKLNKYVERGKGGDDERRRAESIA